LSVSSVSTVLSIRRPRRLAICLTIVALVLVLVAYRLLTSNVRGHKATLLVKTLRGTGRNRHYDDNAVDVDDPLIHRQQQSFQRRHHHHEKALDNDEPALVDERTRIQPRGDSPLSLRDEAPDEEPGHDIPSVTDIPATKTDLLRGRVESVESPSDTLRENDDELSDISKNGHKEHDFGVNKDDVAFDSQQKEGEYVDVASPSRSSSASDVKFNDLMDDGAKAAEDLAETRQRDIVEENPQPTVQDVDIQLPLLSNNKTATGLFHKDIERVADFRKNVVLSVVDSGYVPIAVNFYRTSLVNVPLTNFLMVCTDRMAVKMLSLQGIACSFFDLTEVGHATSSIRRRCSLACCRVCLGLR
jgi:hypothetical protein